jgi:chorismate synthase
MNSVGVKLRVTTFGESHGAAIGCVVDGVPAGLEVGAAYIQAELDRRRPGQNRYATARKESDTVEILSGVFEGLSTGAPIALLIRNEAQKSSDYDDIKDLFRPAHADYTYFKKYGIRDYRGGGRSSARETAARVAAGAIAKKLLAEFGIQVSSGIARIGAIDAAKYDFGYAKTSEIFALDEAREQAMKDEIMRAKNAHDSVGGCAHIRATGVPAGLGEPLYDKLDSALAAALMGINGVKAVEIGAGVEVSKMLGSQNNDQMSRDGFITNHAGGILGGISSGSDIELKVHFKPTPSIFIEQTTQNKQGNETKLNLKGRHDPCIAVRGAVVAEAMTALVLADMVVMGCGATMEKLKKIY